MNSSLISSVSFMLSERLHDEEAVRQTGVKVRGPTSSLVSLVTGLAWLTKQGSP